MTCKGTRVSAAERPLWMAANEAIELAYKNDPAKKNHVVLFGSDFEDSLLKIGPECPKPVPNRRPFRPGTAEINLPKGTGERFGRILLQELRGLARQRRPDIIDFTERAFYEIKTTGYADRGQVQLQSYYKIAEAIRRQYAPDIGDWIHDTAPGWYPAGELAMVSPDPRADYIVCTEATDHKQYNGMVLYDVHRLRRKKRRQRPSEIRMVDYWRAYEQFRQVVRSQLPVGIPEFDPTSPDYVIIVPHEFVQNPQIRKMVEANMAPEWDKFRVDSWMSRNRLTLDPRVKQFWLGVVSIAGLAAIVVITGGMAVAGAGAVAGAVAAPEAGAVAGAVAAVETTAGQSIVVPAAMTARFVAAAGIVATTTETMSLGAYIATISAPAVKAVVATAGILMVIGFAKVAEAKNTPSTLESAHAIRVVPINDFTETAGHMFADSSPFAPDNMYTTKDFKEKFSVGTKLFFDNKQHWVLGQVQVR